MDKYQRKLRLVIATGSAVGFLGGWVLLAHAGKPASAAIAAPPVVESVTLPPIDCNALEDTGNSSSVQSFAPQPMFQSIGRPRLRTAGS